MWLIVLVAIYVGIALIGWIIDRAATLRQNKAAYLARREHELEQEVQQLESEKAAFQQYYTTARNGIEALAEEKALGFPWLATAYSEYFELIDQRLAKELEKKKHPAKRSADVIRSSRERKQRCDVKIKSCANSTDIMNLFFLG